MAWSKLIDLSYSDEEKDDLYGGMADESMPSCPRGLCIRLTTRDLRLLDLPVPEEGDMLDMRCFGTVEDAKDGVLIRLDKISLENEMTEEMGDEE